MRRQLANVSSRDLLNPLLWPKVFLTFSSSVLFAWNLKMLQIPLSSIPGYPLAPAFISRGACRTPQNGKSSVKVPACSSTFPAIKALLSKIGFRFSQNSATGSIFISPERLAGWKRRVERCNVSPFFCHVNLELQKFHVDWIYYEKYWGALIFCISHLSSSQPCWGGHLNSKNILYQNCQSACVLHQNIAGLLLPLSNQDVTSVSSAYMETCSWWVSQAKWLEICFGRSASAWEESSMNSIQKAVRLRDSLHHQTMNIRLGMDASRIQRPQSPLGQWGNLNDSPSKWSVTPNHEIFQYLIFHFIAWYARAPVTDIQLVTWTYFCAYGRMECEYSEKYCCFCWIRSTALHNILFAHIHVPYTLLYFSNGRFDCLLYSAPTVKLETDRYLNRLYNVWWSGKQEKDLSIWDLCLQFFRVGNICLLGWAHLETRFCSASHTQYTYEKKSLGIKWSLWENEFFTASLKEPGSKLKITVAYSDIWKGNFL